MTAKAIENFENVLKYGSKKSISGNLFLLWKSKGNNEKMEYYQSILNVQENQSYISHDIAKAFS